MVRAPPTWEYAMKLYADLVMDINASLGALAALTEMLEDVNFQDELTPHHKAILSKLSGEARVVASRMKKHSR